MRVLLVGIAAAMPLLATQPGAAVELAGAPTWLALGDAGPQAPLSVSVDDTSATGLDVAAALPGVLRTPLKAPNGQAYVQLSVPGCGRTAEGVGLPAMPFKGFFLEIPYGVDVSVELLDQATVSLGFGFAVYPLQLPEPDNGAGAPEFTIDAEAYARDGFVPVVPVTIGEPGFIRGRRVVFVQVFPLQYNPVTTELRAFSSLRFRLKYAGEVDPAGATRRARLATDASDAIARAFILNDAPTVSVVREQAPSGDEGADYLIIVADALYDQILPLAEWKHSKGFVTRVLKMSEVGSTAADVKSAIRTAYNDWTPAPSYVLLVGDNEDVPPDYYNGPKECVTDQPYACVDGADFYPDLTLGRLTVHSQGECAGVVSKILAYDRDPDAGTWYDAFLSAGYFQDDDNNGWADRWFMETSAHATAFVETYLGKTTYTAWCTNSGSHAEYHYRGSGYAHRFAYPDPVPAEVTSLWTSAPQAQSDITAAINAGVGLVLHRDHGGSTGWSDPPYHNGEVNALTNGVKTPVVLSINCLTGSFHYGGGDCFCEAFLEKNGGGAVGIAGATRVSYSGYNDLLAHGILTCFWPSYDPTHTNTTYPHSWRPASALDYGKYYMLTYMGSGTTTQGEFNMFHWFGDPEMMLRTRSPQALSVTHPASVGFAQPVDVTLTIEQEGAPLAGARATLSHADTGEHWTGLTDAAGSITFSSITLSRQGDYTVVVTAHDAVPYQGTLAAVPSSTGTIYLDRDAYACAGTIGLRVTDADIAGDGEQDVAVTTAGGDAETVSLTETDPNSGVFDGTISTGPSPFTAEDGIVQVSHGETITATYQDADDGTGSPATVQDTATADCEPPTISNVQVDEVTGSWATVSFETDTPTTGRVRCGLTCGGPYPIMGEDPVLATTHTVLVTGLAGETSYVFEVNAWDPAGNLTTDDNGGECYGFTTPYRPDYFTELFDAGDNDLAYRSVTFTPDGSGSFYSVCGGTATEFPADPNGGTVLSLDDDESVLVLLSGGAIFSFYGMNGGAFFVGSNGYITAPAGDSNPTESLGDHFSSPRISALFDDLDPSAGGTISWRQLADRIAVTFENVPEAGTANSNSFQTEIFFDGTLRLTWLGIDATDGLVGLSTGQSLPYDFAESDLSGYASCGAQHMLTVTVVNASWGHVELSPEPNDANLPQYAEGTTVMLTAVLDSNNANHMFSHWDVYDPNYPGDTNHAVIDGNNPLTIVMDADREVTAVFKCGSSAGVLLLPAIMLMAFTLIRRRK